MTVADASKNLSTEQHIFVSILAKDTGLDPTVLAAWVRNEEPNAATNTDPAGHGKYNFLNIGITGSKSYGATDSAWSSPVTAAATTAAWLEGTHGAVPGYGDASAGIQRIGATKGQSAEAQIAAITSSGWASGGEQQLVGLYQSFKSQGGVPALSDSKVLSLLSGQNVSGSPIPGDSAANTATDATVNAVQGAASAASAVPDFLAKLSDPQLWLRIAEVVGGGILVILGVLQLTGTSIRGAGSGFTLGTAGHGIGAY